MTDIEKIRKYVEKYQDDPVVYRDAVAILYDGIQQGRTELHGENKDLRKKIGAAIRRTESRRSAEILEDTYYKSLLTDARVDFDAYCQYIERDREPNRRFYLPRRKILRTVAEDLQRLETGGLKLLSISLPPGVGKSTLALFFITWLGGLHPDKAILTFSHDGGIVKGFYGEILRIIGKDSDEYLYRDVFPETESPLVRTDAKELRIDLGKSKRFETFQFTSVGAGNAGKYRASELLYCDDLCSGIEEALSKERMDKLWRTYSTDIRQRTSGDPPELHIATRWSVHDVIGRLERNASEHPTGLEKFIAIPAMNENDESNFDYPMTDDRFTTERYRELRETMDDTDWRALYMNEPIEREGQLYHPDELRRYFELPEREPDAILCVCDTKDKGSDFCAMPIAYQYGQDFYIDDAVYDNSNPEIVEEKLVEKCLKHKVHMGQFESNSAGGRIAESVQKEILARGGRTRLTTQYTTQNKETKIIVASPFVKQHFLFKDPSVVKDKEYRAYMNSLYTYTTAGRNKHDDGPDSIAMLANYVQTFGQGRVEVFKRPF